MSDTETRAALDAAVRDHAADVVADGEVIVAWIALAATKSFTGGGRIIHMPGAESMPLWEARGVLSEALAELELELCDDD